MTERPRGPALAVLIGAVAALGAAAILLHGAAFYAVAAVVVIGLFAAAPRDEGEAGDGTARELTTGERRGRALASALPFLAGFVASDLAGGGGPGLAAFAGAFLVTFGLAQALLGAWLRRRTHAPADRRV